MRPFRGVTLVNAYLVYPEELVQTAAVPGLFDRGTHSTQRDPEVGKGVESKPVDTDVCGDFRVAGAVGDGQVH